MFVPYATDHNTPVSFMARCCRREAAAI